MSDIIPFYGEDLVDQAEAGRILGVKSAMVRKYMKGYEGKPPLPYVRVTREPQFSRIQIAEWMQRVQEQVDPRMIDVRRASKGT